MNFLFIVQGEGRGHMTQAIAFARLLEDSGHQVVGVVLGKSKRRAMPEFFSREIKAPIHLVNSPNFETDKAHRKISIRKTLWKNSLRLGIYWKSLRQIDQIVRETQPDVVLNFYDLLGGLYHFLFPHHARFWVIGHQYLIGHPDFIFAPGRPLDRFLFKLNTALTALGAHEKLALSFTPQRNFAHQKTRVVPPLLRPELKSLTPVSGDFFLAYMVNPGYSEEVIFYAKANPQLRIKAYWDKKDAAETEQPLPNLSFHRVHDRNFLNDMAHCKGLVCTAGFESVCEAMYLGKPVMVIPVAGQYEQACNAREAEVSGAGIASEIFDFKKFEEFISTYEVNPKPFRNWQSNWGNLIQDLNQSVSLKETKKIGLVT